MLVGEKLKAEQSIKHLENSNDLQLSENEKLRTRLKRERDARVMLEEWEKKRLQRLAMLDPLARVVPGNTTRVYLYIPRGGGGGGVTFFGGDFRYSYFQPLLKAKSNSFSCFARNIWHLLICNIVMCVKYMK